jgi:hypothetical protein
MSCKKLHIAKLSQYLSTDAVGTAESAGRRRSSRGAAFMTIFVFCFYFSQCIHSFVSCCSSGLLRAPLMIERTGRHTNTQQRTRTEARAGTRRRAEPHVKTTVSAVHGRLSNCRTRDAVGRLVEKGSGLLPAVFGKREGCREGRGIELREIGRRRPIAGRRVSSFGAARADCSPLFLCGEWL